VCVFVKTVYRVFQLGVSTLMLPCVYGHIYTVCLSKGEEGEEEDRGHIERGTWEELRQEKNQREECCSSQKFVTPRRLQS